MLMSTLCRIGNLDEDDADEDEEEPDLEHDEMWLHKGKQIMSGHNAETLPNVKFRN